MKSLLWIVALFPMWFNPFLHAEEIAWGKHPAVTAAFKEKVISVATALNIDPGHLMTVMAIETSKVVNNKPEPTFDPAIKNPGSSAVGLIQFTAATAMKLGTTTDELRAMSAIDQLDYVQKYFADVKGARDLSTVEDVYLAVFYPKLIGKEDVDVLPDNLYAPNKGFDKDSDGKITKAEIAAYVKKRYEAGLALKG